MARWFRDVTERAGLPGSLHRLRHTALTEMSLAGVPLPVVWRIAGHESITITVDLHGHGSEQAARDAVLAAQVGLGLGRMAHGSGMAPQAAPVPLALSGERLAGL